MALRGQEIIVLSCIHKHNSHVEGSGISLLMDGDIEFITCASRTSRIEIVEATTDRALHASNLHY